ncbi:MAG: uroporphyrinogen-III synthase [Candidatus Geothermarchaeales archaeon]
MNKKPLRVLLIRPVESRRPPTIQAEGVEVIRCPGIRLEPTIASDKLRKALVEDADFVVFTSANAIHLLVELLKEAGKRDDFMKLVDAAKTVAIGPQTRSSLSLHGIEADIVPREFSTYGLVEALAREGVKDKTVLAFRSNTASGDLTSALRELGSRVIEIRFYTVKPTEELREAAKRLIKGDLDAVALTSSSTALLLDEELRRLGSSLSEAAEKEVAVFSIGPLTSKTLRELGVPKPLESTRHTVEALIDSVSVFARPEVMPSC